MLKLYKQVDGVLHYHEAWCNGPKMTEHWGVAGERGESKEHKRAKGEEEEAAVERVLQSALEQGFAPIEYEDHAILLIEYAIDGFGTPTQLKKRHALEDRMNETLGWTGLGMCDGGSIGSGTMEVCCFVADFDVAKRVIENDLKGTEFSDYTRIVREDE
ncbi:MAG: hypothetical protein ACO1RA_21140 [Planctomycetaceae bacterium]